MAKASVEHYRAVYRNHQKHAAMFGVSTKIFNEQVRWHTRGSNHTPSPQLWCSYASLVIRTIAGHRCCPKAVGVPCMCEVSYTCPDHGTRCVGSHD